MIGSLGCEFWRIISVSLLSMHSQHQGGCMEHRQPHNVGVELNYEWCLMPCVSGLHE